MSNYLWNSIYTMSPATPICSNDRGVLITYYRKYLLQKAMSAYEWTMPELWDEDYFKYTLYNIGFVSVLYTLRYGWIPQRCTLAGYNLFDVPNRIAVNNTYVSGIEREIGNACVLFKLNPDYSGITDIIDDYATQLAELRLTAYANMLNSKVSFVFTADDKAQATALGKIFDKILKGEPATITKKSNVGTWDYFSQNVKQNYIVSDILVDMRKLLNAFNTEFGIPNANTEKKERMVVDEVNSNNGDTKVRAAMWLESLQDTCKQLNSIAGEELMSVDWRKEVKDDVQTESGEPA